MLDLSTNEVSYWKTFIFNVGEKYKYLNNLTNINFKMNDHKKTPYM